MLSLLLKPRGLLESCLKAVSAKNCYYATVYPLSRYANAQAGKKKIVDMIRTMNDNDKACAMCPWCNRAVPYEVILRGDFGSEHRANIIKVSIRQH